MSDCLFCKIIAGEIPSEKIYEDEDVYAFYDIGKQAPHHFLVIPKTHIATLNDLNEKNDAALWHTHLHLHKSFQMGFHPQ
jgi:histidine triad (HIT) family protein